MLYVSIGRNVGDTPMTQIRWAFFVEAVTSAMSLYEDLPSPDTVAHGVSNWDGMEEDTAVFVWFEKHSGLRENTVLKLAEIAKEYGQEAIAYTVAPTSFVEA